MLEHQTCLQDELTSHKEAYLFEIFLNTVCKYKRAASINLKLLLKWTSDSEIDSQLNNLSESDILMSLRSRLSIMNIQDNSDQDNSNEQ